MQKQEADGWSLTMFNNPKGVGKRIVVDRQKSQNQIRVQEKQSGRKALEDEKKENIKGRRMGKMLVD